MMKKIIIVFLILSMLLMASCSKSHGNSNIPNDEEQSSEPSQSGTDSEPEPELPPSYAKERKLALKSGTESVTLDCIEHLDIARSIHQYGVPKPEVDDGKKVSYPPSAMESSFDSYSSTVTSVFQTLYRNGEIEIDASKDFWKSTFYLASYKARENGELGYYDEKEITLDELNSLEKGTWFVYVIVVWRGDYDVTYQDYERQTCRYGFALVVDQDYDRDLFLQSQMDILKIGKLREYWCMYGSESWSQRIKLIWQEALKVHLEYCGWQPERIVRPDELEKKNPDLWMLSSEFFFEYNYYPLDPPEILLYRFSLPTIYENGTRPNLSTWEYDLTVLHGDVNTLMTEEERAVFETGHEILTEHEGEDLRFCQAEGIVDYYRDGIRYTYADGELSEIHWESGDAKFWIDMLPAYFTLTESDWETITSPILKRFLDKDQTATAISWFDELIATDEVNQSN